MATDKHAYAVDPPTVPPASGQLTYYGTGSGYLCYYANSSPVGPDEAAVALATAQIWKAPLGGFGVIASGVYDGKHYSQYRENPQTVFPSQAIFSVAQYVCAEGSRNASPPTYLCYGMPNARNEPNECCPCGYIYDTSRRLCALSNRTGCVQEQYTLSLTIDPPEYIEPSGSALVIAKVIDGQDQPKAGVRVRLEVDVDETSGGHVHGGTGRDKGSLSGDACDAPEKSCAIATTGPDGYATFTFGATKVSGKHTVSAACISHACGGSPSEDINVKVDGLNPIPDDPSLYVLIGGEADKKHHDNHYLTDNAMNQLAMLAINYHFLYPNEPVLHLNDASLVWGGKFDIKGNWVGDHTGHRRGTVIDIRANTAPGNIPESQFIDFKKIAAKIKTIMDGRVIPAKAEVHCSRGRDYSADKCIGDDNRHFHMLLLGVDQ